MKCHSLSPFGESPISAISWTSYFLISSHPAISEHSPDNRDCRYRIFTRAIDRPRLEAAQSVARLRELLAVDLVEVPGLGEQKEHPHQVYADMTRCHMRGVTDADDVGAAVVFLPADSLWSEGSFAALVGHYDAGKTAVMLPGIRLCAEPFREVFLDRFYDPSTGEAVAPARGAHSSGTALPAPADAGVQR